MMMVRPETFQLIKYVCTFSKERVERADADVEGIPLNTRVTVLV